VAASHGHHELVDELLEARADPNALDAFGNTPFNDAVRLKHDAVSNLIRSKFPRMKYKLPGSELGVLMCTAAAAGDVDELRRLTTNGVDPNSPDYDGRTGPG
jgi:hypothetical protein